MNVRLLTIRIASLRGDTKCNISGDWNRTNFANVTWSAVNCMYDLSEIPNMMCFCSLPKVFLCYLLKVTGFEILCIGSMRKEESDKALYCLFKLTFDAIICEHHFWTFLACMRVMICV